MIQKRAAEANKAALEAEKERTKIPDPPIHFSGPTNFFGPKIDFTNHQF
jgi:hypothetical protein